MVDFDAILEFLERRSSWWPVQLAALLSLGFVGLLRLGELVRLNVDDIRFVWAADRRHTSAASVCLPA